MEGKKEMLKEEMRQRKTERRCCGGPEVCAPPPPSQLDGEEKRSVRGDKVGGRGQREAEETESV